MTAFVFDSHDRYPVGNVDDTRIPAIDCLRGLMLAMVLADHIDALTFSNASIGKWTLMGLGFSDAADVFVFLSGFVFGLAYGKRIRRVGRWSSLKHGCVRILQIYVGYLTCTFCVSLLQLCAGTTDWTNLYERGLSSLYLANHLSDAGILCLYVVLLPWLLLLLISFHKQWWWIALGVSLATYAAAQFAASHGWQLPKGWVFQPMAWQLLMVIAAILGRQFGAIGSIGWVRSRTLFGMAIAVLLLGLAVKKSAMLPFDWTGSPFLTSHFLIGKSNWGPLRGLHLLSLVYVTNFLVPIGRTIWSIPLLEPLRVCGRHSLTVFCVGIVLTQVVSILTRSFGQEPSVVWIMVIDALVLQWAVAWSLDRRNGTRS